MIIITEIMIIMITMIRNNIKFRVTAYNAAGESETSETSTAIEVNILILFNINIGDIDLYDDDDNKPNLSVIDT